tara:strand:+ start:403 stop:690 length:288 start_codon:yes stop_codon:yes gene_type:complete
MSKGFAVNADGSWAGWYGHEQDFISKSPRLPVGVIFVKDDDSNPDVAAVKNEMNTPRPAVVDTFQEDMISAVVGNAGEQSAAKKRLRERRAANGQ